MGRAKPVEIGEYNWDYQKDALAYYGGILNAYGVGDVLGDKDFDDIFNLVKNHPSAPAKIGVGVQEIFVGSDGYAGKCFHIRRTDGSVENFSYKKAVVGQAGPFTLFSKACRKAVEPDIIQVKDRVFAEKEQIKCQETGVLLTKDEVHLDRRQPNTFSVIVDRFIELEDMDLETVAYESAGEYGRTFQDQGLADRFRAYHKKKATLRVVSRDINARRSHMGRVQPQKKDLTID